MKKTLLKLVFATAAITTPMALNPFVNSVNNNKHIQTNLNKESVITNNFKINKMDTNYGDLGNQGKLNISHDIYNIFLYFFFSVLTPLSSKEKDNDIKGWVSNTLDKYTEKGGIGYFSGMVPSDTNANDSFYNWLFGAKDSIAAKAASKFGWEYNKTETIFTGKDADAMKPLQLVNNLLNFLIIDYIVPSFKTSDPVAQNSSELGIKLNSFIKWAWPKSTESFGYDISKVLDKTFLSFVNTNLVSKSTIYNPNDADSEFTIGAADLSPFFTKPTRSGSLYFWSLLSNLPEDITKESTNLTSNYLKNTMGNFIYAQNIMNEAYKSAYSDFNKNPKASLRYLLILRTIFPWTNNPLNFNAKGNSRSTFSPALFTTDRISTFSANNCDWELYTKIITKSQTSLETGKFNVLDDSSNASFYSLKNYLLPNPLKGIGVDFKNINKYFNKSDAIKINTFYTTVIEDFKQLSSDVDSFDNLLNKLVKDDLSYFNAIKDGAINLIKSKPGPESNKLTVEIIQQLSDANLANYFDLTKNRPDNSDYINKMTTILSKVVENYSVVAEKEGANKLSNVTIAGIIIATTILLLIASLTVFFVYRKRYSSDLYDLED